MIIGSVSDTWDRNCIGNTGRGSVYKSSRIALMFTNGPLKESISLPDDVFKLNREMSSMSLL